MRPTSAAGPELSSVLVEGSDTTGVGVATGRATGAGVAVGTAETVTTELTVAVHLTSAPPPFAEPLH